jgi:hypothetical protein
MKFSDLPKKYFVLVIEDVDAVCLVEFFNTRNAAEEYARKQYHNAPSVDEPEGSIYDENKKPNVTIHIAEVVATSIL